MRLKAGGLLWEAVVCSSFVFANSSNTKRTVTNPYGATEYEQVLQGNMMADMAAFFMALASSRGVEVCLENPAGSMIFRYPPLVEVLAGLKVVTTTTDQCWFSSKPFGKRWQKKFKLAATGTWIFRMSRSCRCPGGVHEPLMTTNENGAVTGTKQLKLSQAYLPKFGESVVAAWALGEMKQVDDIAARCKKRNFKDVDELTLRLLGRSPSLHPRQGQRPSLRPRQRQRPSQHPGQLPQNGLRHGSRSGRDTGVRPSRVGEVATSIWP
jgi:hypothetical protein